jgi:hypothetical protein
VITMQLPMASEQYPDGPRIINYLEQVMEKIQAVPGVRDVATTAALPFEGWGDDMWFQIEGKPLAEKANRPTCGFKRVSPSYLSTLGMRLLEGRCLTETDTSRTLPVKATDYGKALFQRRGPHRQASDSTARCLDGQVTQAAAGNRSSLAGGGAWSRMRCGGSTERGAVRPKPQRRKRCWRCEARWIPRVWQSPSRRRWQQQESATDGIKRWNRSTDSLGIA